MRCVRCTHIKAPIRHQATYVQGKLLTYAGIRDDAKWKVDIALHWPPIMETHCGMLPSMPSYYLDHTVRIFILAKHLMCGHVFVCPHQN